VTPAGAAGTATAATLWAVFLVGLAGGFGHCIAMCGPFVAASGFASGAATSGGPGAVPRMRSVALWQFAYHGGRLLTYACLGALLGALGSIPAMGGAFGGLQRWVWLVAGVLMILMGLAVAGVPFAARMQGVLERGAAAATAGWVGRAYGTLARSGPAAALPLGMLMGLLPCGFLLSIEASALGSSSPAMGAATMIAFGLGTVPALATFGAAGGLLGTRGRVWLLYAGAAIVVVLGAYYVVRAAGVLMGVPG
jgi:sulfite exporter TauE/SafE